MSTLFLNGKMYSALCAVRSLGMKGIRVAVADDSKRAMSLFSKYCSQKFIYPSPKIDLPRYTEKILDIVKFNNIETIFCFNDATFLSVSRARDKFPPSLRLPIACKEAVETAYSKEATLKMAQKISVPIPQTYFVQSLREVEKISREVSYPLVLKARESCSWKDGKIIPRTTTYVNSKEMLKPECEKEFMERGEFPLIQEYIPGDGYGAFALFNRGEIRAFFAHRRIRSFSPAGGASVFRESIEAPPTLRGYGVKLLKALNWHGVAMVEFKRDSRDGEFKLMEINGRFWGSLPLAVASGVDFPYLLYKMTIEGDVEPVFHYKVGVKSRHLLGDLQHLFKALKNKDRVIGVDSPSLFHALYNFLKFYGNELNYDIISLNDPLPFLVELTNEIQRISKKAFARIRRRI